MPDKEALDLIHGAVRLSSNVLAKDPGQFASQMVGRLLPHSEMPAIERFTAKVSRVRAHPGCGFCNQLSILRELR